jgi:hypothetical protein
VRQQQQGNDGRHEWTGKTVPFHEMPQPLGTLSLHDDIGYPAAGRSERSWITACAVVEPDLEGRRLAGVTGSADRTAVRYRTASSYG